MFGKRKSSTDNFVMAMGRKAGNLPAERAKAGRPATKSIDAAKAGAGKKVHPNQKPAAPKPQMHPGNGETKKLSLEFKRGLGVNQNDPQSLGKGGTFDMGKVGKGSRPK